jgi:hypothetical protein
MKEKREGLRKDLNLAAIVLLIVGLCSAGVIYTREAGNAGNKPSDTIGYLGNDAGGPSYAVSPRDSKSYQRDMELYGGTANLLADELRRWFDGLWQGQTLAYTVGFLTLFGTLVLLGVANYVVPFSDEDDEPDGGGGS